MRMFRTIGLVVLGALLGAGIVVARETANAQGTQATTNITLSATEWNTGQGFRYVREGKTRRCFLASLNPRDSTITAMVEAPGACQ